MRPCGVNRKMLVQHVLTKNKTSEPFLQKTEQWEVTEGRVLTVIQEITNIDEGSRGELSAVTISIHENNVFLAEEVKLSSHSP